MRSLLAAPWLLTLLSALIPLAAGALTVPVLDAVKRAWSRLDGAPAWVKRVAAVAVATAFTAAARQVPELAGVADPSQLGPDGVQAAIAAALAMLVKQSQQGSAARRTADTAIDAARDALIHASEATGTIAEMVTVAKAAAPEMRPVEVGEALARIAIPSFPRIPIGVTPAPAPRPRQPIAPPYLPPELFP